MEKALDLRADSKASKVASEDASLGPVDNSDIIEEVLKDSTGKNFVRLKPGSGLESFELFPEDAWKMVVAWYGIQDGQVAIVTGAGPASSSGAGRPSFKAGAKPLLAKDVAAYLRSLAEVAEPSVDRIVVGPSPHSNRFDPSRVDINWRY